MSLIKSGWTEEDEKKYQEAQSILEGLSGRRRVYRDNKKKLDNLKALIRLVQADPDEVTILEQHSCDITNIIFNFQGFAIQQKFAAFLMDETNSK